MTGNTEKLAEVIAAEIREKIAPEELVYFGKPEGNMEADLYFIGSWTDKGMCSEKIADVLKTLKNKKIAYFGTAGFGGSEEYYQTLFDRIKANIDGSNEIVETYFCQGKMPAGVRTRYEKMLEANPSDKRLQASIENFDKAFSHPNEEDFVQAREWAKNVLTAYF